MMNKKQLIAIAVIWAFMSMTYYLMGGKMERNFLLGYIFFIACLLSFSAACLLHDEKKGG
jgi:hypothetical protein